MGMPVTIEIVDATVSAAAIEKIFKYFTYVDETFSTYKPESEISRINRQEILPENYSDDMKEVLKLSEETKRATNGYFDVRANDASLDPSGLVKGWAIYNAACLLTKDGFKNFYVEAGGDIEVRGTNASGEAWRVGLRSPFDYEKIVKTVAISNQGIATSGTYLRGQHVYNPHRRDEPLSEVVSLSVIGPNIYEADRFATAAFAMGRQGIMFVEKLAGFEGYQIDRDGIATMTSGFEKYVINYA